MSKSILEQIEAYAETLAKQRDAHRVELQRLIAAHAKILAARVPDQFQRAALRRHDEAGHFDNSFPPSIVNYDRTGPAVLELIAYETEQVPTSSGFYHSCDVVTVDTGAYVDANGNLYCANERGTCRIGQFAAHPGVCDYSTSIEWVQVTDMESP